MAADNAAEGRGVRSAGDQDVLKAPLCMTCMNEQLSSGQVLGAAGQERRSAIDWRRVFVHASRFGRSSGHGGSGQSRSITLVNKRMEVDAGDDKEQERPVESERVGDKGCNWKEEEPGPHG